MKNTALILCVTLGTCLVTFVSYSMLIQNEPTPRVCIDNKIYIQKGDMMIEDPNHLSCIPISKD